LLAAVVIAGTLGCGTADSSPDAGSGGEDALNERDAMNDLDAMVGLPDASIGDPDAASGCASFSGAWHTTETSFADAVGATALVDFETMGDGVTTPSAGVEVPVDEYEDCCGILVEYEGTDASGRLIWAGNSDGGFSLRTACDGLMCAGDGPHTVVVTFLDGASAAGGLQPATSYSAWVHDEDGNEVGPQTGTEWMGYTSPSVLVSAQFGRGGNGDLESVRYQPCE
jgi:hypothetical protein